METESRKKALQYFFDKVVGPLGFKFTPDVELKDFLLAQEVMLESKHGIPFCPCIPFHREYFDSIKRCWCGLFVHKDVNDPDSLPQLPPKDVGLE